MKEIGGYFEFEFDIKSEYHLKAIKLNSGRNAFLLALRTKKINRIFLPSYICDGMIEQLRQEKIDCVFYSIQENLEPKSNLAIKKGDALFFVNYFGIQDPVVGKFQKIYDQMIIDNAQAFFHIPSTSGTVIYSPRKFFGVPDGGYLYIEETIKENFNTEVSYKKCLHLLKRFELNARTGFISFRRNENSFKGLPIKKMSLLTQAILSSLDYQSILVKRKKNFQFLHAHFKDINELPFVYEKISGPMVYPLLLTNKNIRKHLIKNKIYIPIYWKEVLQRVEQGSYENKLANFLLPLPIDQRYDLKDMKRIVDVILNHLA
jgi:hypothetical protein